MLSSDKRLVLIILTFIFIVASAIFQIESGIVLRKNIFYFILELLPAVPAVFLIIGIFKVWIKRSTVIKYIGAGSGFLGYFLVILLSTANVGGMYLAFPFAYMLHKKGARPAMVFTYLGSAGLVRINMLVFEINSLGFKFTAIRLLTAIPLTIAGALVMEKFSE